MVVYVCHWYLSLGAAPGPRGLQAFQEAPRPCPPAGPRVRGGGRFLPIPSTRRGSPGPPGPAEPQHPPCFLGFCAEDPGAPISSHGFWEVFSHIYVSCLHLCFPHVCVYRYVSRVLHVCFHVYDFTREFLTCIFSLQHC